MSDEPEPWPLLCALCLFSRESPEVAITVMNGTAVCEDHAGYVHGSEFTRALIKVRADARGLS